MLICMSKRKETQMGANMIRVVMRGCNGKMGREISRLIELEEGICVVAGIDRKGNTDLPYPVFNSFLKCNVEADVIIDFSSPVDINEMLDYGKINKLPIVLCTTGLTEEDLNRINETSKHVAILRSANMSLGINTMVKLIKEATRVLANADFDIEIVEKHHNQKIDAPSGTALLLADAMNEVLDEEYTYKYDRTMDTKKRDKQEIGISAIRGGSIIGEHEVIFAGLDEVIEIKHTAYSRAIFAKGAIAAAKYVVGKEAGMYSMNDVIS